MKRTAVVVALFGLVSLCALFATAQTKSTPPIRKAPLQAAPIKPAPSIISGPLTVQKGASIRKDAFSTLRTMCEIKGQLYGAADDKVVVLDDDGKVLREISTKIKAPSIARYNDDKMLIGDCDTKTIYTLDLKSGRTARLVTVDKLRTSGNPRAELVKSAKMVSVASDGEYLYAAFSAGYSSSIVKIDAKKGEVVEHTWAPGDNPSAMVFDKDNLFVLEGSGKQIRRFDKSLKPSYQWVEVPAADGRGLILKDDGFKVFSPSAREIVTLNNVVDALIKSPLSIQLSTPGAIIGSIAQFLPQKYAVLICGDIAESCYYCDSFWNDTLWMYKTLIAKGYTKENIYVLYGNGSDFASANPRYQYPETVTDYPATITWVNTVFDGLKNGDAANGISKLKDNDSLFVWTFDHGAGGNLAYLCLMDGNISDTSFAAKLNAAPYAKRAVYMQQCRSGGFIDNLAEPKSFISTACRADQNASAADTENETYGGQTYWHGEYNYHLISAIGGSTPSGTAVNADADGSGKVSALEAHQWVLSHDSKSESPQMSNPGGVGSTWLY